MKKICFSLKILLLCGILFSACGSTDNMKQGNDAIEQEGSNSISQSVETIDFPTEYKTVVESVTFDTVIEIPQNLDQSQLKRTTATAQMPNIEKATELFGFGKEISESIEETGSGDYGTFDIIRNTYADGTYLSVDTGVFYSTPFSGNINQVFRLERFPKNEPLGFKDSEQAFGEIKQSIEQLGYELSAYHYDYYALEHQTLQQQKKAEDIMGRAGEKLEWSEKDDAYYFFATQVHQGIPLYFGLGAFPEDDDDLRPIRAIYSERGIELLSIRNIYQFQTKEEVVALLPFEAIAEGVAKKYGNLITSANYCVNRAKLYQFPVRNTAEGFDIKVGWYLEIEESGFDSESNENYTNTLYTFIDAETGKEILL